MLGQRARREAHLRNAEPSGDLGGLVGKLEGPDRVRGVDLHGAVPGKPGRPGVAGDRLTDRRGPALDNVREPGLGAEAGELGPDLVT